MKRSRKIEQKPHCLKICVRRNNGICVEDCALSFFYIWNRLTCRLKGERMRTFVKEKGERGSKFKGPKC